MGAEKSLKKFIPGEKAKRLYCASSSFFCKSLLESVKNHTRDFFLILKTLKDDSDPCPIEEELLSSLLTCALPNTNAVPGSCFYGRELSVPTKL